MAKLFAGKMNIRNCEQQPGLSIYKRSRSPALRHQGQAHNNYRH